MMGKILSTFIVLLFSTSAWAGSFSSSAKGTTTAGFLKLGVGAKAVSMGEAYSALADDAGALYWNPAALMQIPSKSATFMHAVYIESSFFDYLAYGQRLKERSAFGMSIQYFSAGSLTETDETGTEVGSFTPNDIAITVGYAHEFKGYSFGLGAKFIQSKIIDSANAFALDVGVLSSAYLNNKLRLAFTATNLGTKMKFDEEKEDLPLTLKLGSAFKLTDSWISSLDIGFPKDNEPHIALGTEYLLPVSDAWNLAGRAGLNSRTMGDVDGFTGISFGLGIAFQKLAIDYGFLPFGSVGSAHRISLSLNF